MRALIAMVALVLAGCTVYTRIEPQEVGDHHAVRVTYADGERELVHDPELVGDSIAGSYSHYGERLMIPLADVRGLEYQGKGVTPLGVLGILLGGLFVASSIACAGEGDWC